MLKHLDSLQSVLGKFEKKRLAVVWAQDENTINAVADAVKAGIVTPYMIGVKEKILSLLSHYKLNPDNYVIIDTPNEEAAAELAVAMVKNGEADILMKGLISSSTYLKAILNKEKGILPKGNVLSHLSVLELPTYHKLLFVSDVAVIPFPNVEQKKMMIEYALEITKKMGINKPKISLLSATEKPTSKLPASVEAIEIVKHFREKYQDKIIIDGPLDIFLSVDPVSVEIKGVPTPVAGDADIIIFPNIETGNAFYKSLIFFTKGKLAAVLTGTEHPVILTSRSDSNESKFYSILLGCLMAEKNLVV